MQNNILFFPFGIPILALDVLADLWVFWKNSFREGETLDQIIIIKEKSTIVHKSIREIMNVMIKYNLNKIKATHTSTIIKNFSKSFSVTQNIQFLIFGQMIPIGGWGDDANGNMYKGYTLKTMKTQELEEQRNIELKALDDTNQIIESKMALNQFNQVKKILMNFAFKEKGKSILSSEINMNVLDEMRR